MYARGVPFLWKWLVSSPLHVLIYFPFLLMTAVVATCGNEWSRGHGGENQLAMESRINTQPRPRLTPRHKVRLWQSRGAGCPLHSQATLGRPCNRCGQGKCTTEGVPLGPRPTDCLAKEGILFSRTETSLTLQHLHSHLGHTVGFVLVQPNGLRQHHLPKAALSQGFA